MNILVINGPNLNMLGIREPDIYGKDTYNDLEQYIQELASKLEFNIEIKQSNYEGEIVTWIQEAHDQMDYILINPGALTHYSYALYDAIKSVNVKTIEIHLSDPDTREDFRKVSVVKNACVATFKGLHFESYKKGLLYIKENNKQ